MRFKLVEAPERQWPPAVSTLDAYNKLGSQEEQTNFLKKHILPQPAFRKLFGVRPIIVNCILKYGLDPARNPFLKFLTSLTVEMLDSKTYKQKVQYLYNAFENKHITSAQLKMDVFNNPTLYTRNYKDFQYTVKAFLTFSDPKRVSVYLKDTKVANIGAFMNGKTIKPAGLDGKGGPTDTIYNIIEGWASNGNEYSEEEIASNKVKEKEEEESKNKDKKNGSKYVLEDVIPRESWNYEIFKKNIEMAFKHKTDLKINSTKEECLEKAYIAFEYPKLVETSTLTAVQGTKNKISNKTAETITDADVKTFGDPANKPDEPIHIKVLSDGKTEGGVSGVFVFHEFVPLSKDNINNLKQLSAKYVRDMEVKTFVASNDRTLDKLQGLITILEQVG